MKKIMTRLMAMVLALTMLLGMGAVALADDTDDLDDILSFDGKNLKFYLNSGDYDYVEKYLYDVSFWYAQDSTVTDPTLGYIINFLSTGRQEGYDARVDLEAFVNSALGEKTAQLWYIHMLYEDQMAEGLLEYWENHGILKEAYYDEEGDDDGIDWDYYVYTPTEVEASEDGYPLLIVYHGGGEVAYQTETFGFLQVAAEEGFVVVATESFYDEEGTLNVISQVEENYNIDASRVYITGSSGGGSYALQFAMANQDIIAGVAVMDQPVSVETRWYTASDEELETLSEYGLAMVYLGGTADMYGLYGTQDVDFFLTSEGAEDQFISGWNRLMEALGIEDKEITTRVIEEPANEAEEYAGYPFDNVEDIDESGTSAIWKCTMDGCDTLTLYLVYNRAHMPSGFDAENIWSSLSLYRRNLETGYLELVEE